MTASKKTKKSATAQVKADTARIDRLKEQLRSTPKDVDFERVRIMEEVYEDTAGDQQILRRAKFFATLLERKKLYIDDNLFVGSMASTINGIYTFPEWNIDWMKEENTVEKSKTPEDRKANEWALKYWEKRSLRPRTLEIFEKRYGFDPRPVYQAGLIAEFFSWPGGGGNLNYPKIYKEGMASVLKDVKERQMALEMRLPNASQLYFYEACQIVMKAVIRLSHRYAELAREMAAKEKTATRKAELIAIAETCEWVPEHPARNLRGGHAVPTSSVTSAQKSSRSAAVIPKPTLGQNMEPYYQRDKAAGLVTYDDADLHVQEPRHQAERDRLLLWQKGRHPELCRPGTEYYPCGLYRGRGRCHRGNGLRDPRCMYIPGFAPASAVMCAHRRHIRANSSKKSLMSSVPVSACPSSSTPTS